MMVHCSKIYVKLSSNHMQIYNHLQVSVKNIEVLMSEAKKKLCFNLFFSDSQRYFFSSSVIRIELKSFWTKPVQFGDSITMRVE